MPYVIGAVAGAIVVVVAAAGGFWIAGSVPARQAAVSSGTPVAAPSGGARDAEFSRGSTKSRRRCRRRTPTATSPRGLPRRMRRRRRSASSLQFWVGASMRLRRRRRARSRRPKPPRRARKAQKARRRRRQASAAISTPSMAASPHLMRPLSRLPRNSANVPPARMTVLPGRPSPPKRFAPRSSAAHRIRPSLPR